MILTSPTPKTSIQTYLDEVVSISYGDTKKDIRRLERIVELFVMNNYNFNVTGWGNITTDGDINKNPYGRYGLYRDEAIELMKYEAFILGYVMCDTPENTAVWFKQFYDDAVEPTIKDAIELKQDEVAKMVIESGGKIPDNE